MTNDELKARLRYTIEHGLFAAAKVDMAVSYAEALAAIERLEAEAIALTTYRENLRDECRELLAKIERLEADNARLRGANQAAAECVAAMMEECARYRDEIRAALQETSHD